MALLFMDGFDKGDFASKWATAGSNNAVTSNTRFGTGSAYYSTANSANNLSRNFTASATTIIGSAFKMLTAPSGYPEKFLSLRGDAGVTEHLYLSYTSSTGIGLYRSTTLLGSATIAPLSWQYLEISATIADAGGTVTVKINGTTVISFTGDTKNAGTNTTLDRLVIGCFNSLTHTSAFDDLYICNGTGSTNNTFLGDVRVQTLSPTGAGSSTQFAPTGGANYANVAETPDSTATYNSSTTVGERDTYVMSDLAAGTTAVLGVQDNLAAWKSDAGAGSVKAALKVGSTVYYDTTIGLGTNVGSWYGAVREVNPATSTAWIPSDVNDIEFGAEVA